jgi:hypothetical protein
MDLSPLLSVSHSFRNEGELRQKRLDVLRNQSHGRIAFANADFAGASDHCNSIREADRAVKQLV